jgi:hypothetical protein
MKVKRYNYRPEDMLPSTLLDMEIWDNVRFEETEDKRLREEVRVLRNIIGEMLNEMEKSNEEALQRIFRNSISVVRIIESGEANTDDLG